jgi:4-amino-4-deoxy-L-arabinose transferase-like glycosyltransferase
VNPVLAGLNVLLTHVLIAHIYSRRIARRTAVLLALSPWFLFLAMSYMPHQLMLFFTLVAGVGISLARRSNRAGWALVAGAAVGGVSLIRPLDGVVIGALAGLWALGFGGRRLRFGSLVAFGAGAALVGALVFPYNRMLTGDPLTFPINAYINKHYTPNANSYGFGPDRGMGWPTDPNPGHTPVDGVINANLNTFAINTDLFGWITGSLIFVAWLFCARSWRRQDSLMVALLVAFPLAYFPYYFSGGPDFGARYWFPAIIPLIALSVRGMQTVAESAGTRVWLAVTALSVMTLVTYLPWRGADKYHHYRGMLPDVRTLARTHDFGADIVLVRGNRFPDYASAFAQNPVDLRSPQTIYAWDRDAETRAAVLSAYRDRRVWMIDGPSITGRGFEVSAGPVPAEELLKQGLK